MDKTKLKNKIRVNDGLQESEARFESIFDSVSDGLLLANIKTKKLYRVNKKMCAMLGYSEKELLKLSIKDIHPKSDLPYVLKQFQKQVKGEIGIARDIPIKRKDGSIFYADISAHPARFGKDIYNIGVFVDITEAKKAAEDLKESEERYRLLFERANDGIIILQDGLIKYGNKAVEKICGEPIEKIIGHKFTDYVPKEERAKLLKNYKMKLAGKNFDSRYETTLLYKKRDKVYVELNSAKIIYQGRPADHVVVRNITDRIKVELVLRESEEKYRRLFESAKDSILILDADNGEITASNPFVQKSLGYSAEELVGKKIFEISPFKDIVENKEKFQELKKKGYVYYSNLPLETKSGVKRYVEFVSNVYLVGNKKVIQCNIRDITDRRVMEEALEKREAELAQKVIELYTEKTELKKLQARDESILLSIGEGLIVTDAKHRIVLINDTFERLTGWRNREVIGKKLDQILHRESGGKINKNSLNRSGISVDAGAIIKTDWWCHCKNKTKFLATSVITPIHIKGKLIGQVEILRDVTKERELDQAKTDFLSLASHQLRTPLSATKWVLEILGSDKNSTAKQQEKFRDLVSSNERLIGLVNDLLDVTRIEAGKLLVDKELTNLKELVEGLSISLKTLAFKKKKTIKIILPPGLKRLYCDPILVHEALGNLLNNAINYSPVGSSEIKLEIKERPEDYLISVHNEGVIDPTIAKSNLFSKFVRGTKAASMQPSGSGLGLYITKRVVIANGGTIWFESSPELGTTFYFTLVKTKLRNYKR